MDDAVTVIVARYTEDVSWVERLGYNSVVYDKSDAPAENARQLENIGREAHTYFTHIVNEYETLSPMNVFVQGDPFDHLDDRGRTDVDGLRKQLVDVVDRALPFKGLAWFKLKCDRLGRPHDLRKLENKGRWAGWGRDIPVGAVFEELFHVPMPEQLIVRAPTGNFCVSGDRIRTRPISFYQHCLHLVEQDPFDEYNTGHAFERLWQHIFNGNTAWNSGYPVSS
ncbi:DUF3431 domain-containing protein [Pseudodesulfovibrio sp. JC047]|uniref:DUF3431 domain-containing protein n=1 Tax=Pseudodesulfovibrio sp. JC047 TaxID=2683199 RepID=UPI0013D29760|nr:DUF3431 domain-containing protein [Pseudodesulfovibrio sp. JC047]NDV19987.1 DUF3431 domain-containing protein [Pseudodesulfovibrio sp. JC047]